MSNVYHCKGKLKFKSKTRATKAKQNHTYRLNTYPCHHCGGWHNGNDDGYVPADKAMAIERRKRIEETRAKELAEVD